MSTAENMPPKAGHNRPPYGWSDGSAGSAGEDDSPELQELWRRVNLAFLNEARAHRQVTDGYKERRHWRLESGRLLIEARDKFRAEHPGRSFKKACEAKRGEGSYRDCQKRIRMALDADPEAAHAREKAATRERMRRKRAALRAAAQGGGAQAECAPPTDPATFRVRAEWDPEAHRPAQEAEKREAERKAREEEQERQRAAQNREASSDGRSSAERAAAASETITTQPADQAVADEAVADDGFSDEIAEELMAETAPVPDIPPPLPPEVPAMNPNRAKILGALRLALNAVERGQEPEAISALQAVIRMGDARLILIEEVEESPEWGLVKLYGEQVKRYTAEAWKCYERWKTDQEKVRRLQEEVRKLQARDRERLKLIRALNAKIELLEKAQPPRTNSDAEHAMEATAVDGAVTPARSSGGQQEPITADGGDNPLRNRGDIDPRTTVVGAKLVKGDQNARTKGIQASPDEMVRAPFAVIRPTDCVLRGSIGCPSRKVCHRKDQCLESERRSRMTATRIAAE